MLDLAYSTITDQYLIEQLGTVSNNREIKNTASLKELTALVGREFRNC